MIKGLPNLSGNIADLIMININTIYCLYISADNFSQSTELIIAFAE
jgi:hypothetical protein